jgi:hypothetical protein
MSSLTKHFNSWDTQLQRVLFGCKCAIQAKTILFPLSILIGRTLTFKANKKLSMLIHIMEEYIKVKEMVDKVIANMKLIATMHKAMLGNVE